MGYTNNYNFNKMDSNSYFKVKDLNENWDKVDSKLKEDADTVDAVKNTVSDEFNTESTYSVGDMCIYDNALYKFTSAKEAGKWNRDIVKQTTVANTVSELNSKIKHIEIGTTKARSVTFENAFENIPTVALTVKKENYKFSKNTIFTVLKSVTTTGFTFSVCWLNADGEGGDADEAVSWIAIG